ncbi:MAG: amidohydrolase [Mesotoga sp.]|uniref:amidohydrolase n=1 Tax=Mesotoga sp. TaxID=2053577 RepID=UPI002631C547|nr:amidohydrolase [Mesotoga sp.]MDI9366848.1 amidohydrolase [Thermotogota bacterium]MDD2332840.1 amidohydrolase [Mesotoga sp.]MDD3680091.1 amidohydrolase [Mesotoga sp.]MDD4206655.1 amidohydrolase [Mesotoga sp.]MDD4824767.1 amidohydrolase [Mesotoga sp.]
MIVTNVLAFTNDLKNPLVDDALIRFENGEITFVGPRREYSIQEDEEIVDGEKGILLPSIFNAHYSVYSSISSYPLRLLKDAQTGRNFFGNLLESGTSEVNSSLVRLSAEIAILKSIRSGSVAISGPVIDHPDIDPEFYRRLSQKYGVYLAVGPVLTDRTIDEVSARWENVSRDSSFCPIVYVSGLATYGEEALFKLRSLYEKGMNLNLFIFDMKQDNEICLFRWGESLVERLLKNGILVPECGVIYGGNLSETDMDIISSRRIFVTKSLRSEMYAGTFKPNIADLLGRGMQVCIGTGFVGSDMLGEAKEVLLTERYQRNFENSIIDYEIRKTLFDNNYKLFQRFFGKRTGVLKEGYSADLILSKSSLDLEKFDTRLPTTLQLILKSSFDSSFEKVWNSGELIMDKGVPQRISRKELRDLTKELRSLEL